MLALLYQTAWLVVQADLELHCLHMESLNQGKQDITFFQGLLLSLNNLIHDLQCVS